MSHPINTAAVTGVALVAWLVTAIALPSLRQERCEKTATGVVFRQPLTSRLCLLMMATFIISCWPIAYLGGLMDAGGFHPTMTSGTWVMFGLNESLCIAIGAAIYYFSGPNDVFIDLERRTYRLVTGPPHNPNSKEGTLDDLAGVFVWCRYLNSDYRVGIVWKEGRKPGRKRFVMVGSLRRSGAADRLAQETAVKLGLPLVEPPYPFRSSTRLC